MMNYIILGSNDDNIKYNYKEAIEDENVLYLADFFCFMKKNFINKLVIQVIHTEKIPYCLKFVFLRIVESKIIKKIKKFTKNYENNFCFIFYMPWYKICKYGLLSRLKEKFNTSKFVWIFADIIESYGKWFDLFYLKRNFDLLISFDMDDVSKYNLAYYPEIYPNKIIHNKNSYPICDVIFLGRAKKRLQIILDIFRYLNDAGIKCEFFIAGVEKDKRKFEDSIHYLDTLMPYDEYLQRLDSSKCVLEILQNTNNHGYTTRTSEALVYGKRLISNNVGLLDAPFYEKNNIQVITKAEDIDVEFLKGKYEFIEYPFKKELSFYSMCSFIEKYFNS